MNEYGPQVTARKGTKRWFAQVAKRRTFLAVMESSHHAEARRHAAAEATLRADAARHQADADAFFFFPNQKDRLSPQILEARHPAAPFRGMEPPDDLRNR